MLRHLWPSSARERSRFSAANTIAQGRQGLPQALVSEFHETFLFALVTASICDALAASRPVRLPGTIGPFLPRDPAAFSANAAFASLDDRTASFIVSLQEFYAHAAFSKKMTQACFRSDATVPLSDLANVIDAWRRTNSIAATACHSITEFGGFAGDFLERHKRLQAQAAEMRSRPETCILADGTIVIPRWMESRAHRRISKSIWIWIEVDSARHQVVLRDVSRGGVGFSGCPTMNPGTPIALELTDGTRIPAVVEWSVAERAGASFVEELPAVHWLLDGR